MKQEFAAIKKFYGDQVAERSGVPLINHIVEGIVVLREIKAWHRAYCGWCLHPLVQSDENLLKNLATLRFLSGRNIALAMEYRAVANGWLSDKVQANMMLVGEPQLSPVKCVNDMLIADKVQNRKDFETYHKGTHARSAQLDLYFKVWLDRLGVTEEQYQYLCHKIDEVKLVGVKPPIEGPACNFIPEVFPC